MDKVVKHKVVIPFETISRLRTKVWARVVFYKGGFSKGYQAQKFFTPEKFTRKETSGTSYPKQWNRYIKGEVTPRISTILKVDFHFPGTARWFLMPFWDAIIGTYSSDKEISELVLKLEESEARNLVVSNEATKYNLLVETDNLSQRINKLRLINLNDALSSLVILLLKAELEKQTKHKKELLDAISDLILNSSVMYDGEIEFIQLFHSVIYRFSYRWYKDDQNNQNVVSDFTKPLQFNLHVLKPARQFIKVISQQYNLVDNEKELLVLFDCYRKKGLDYQMKYAELFFADFNMFFDHITRFFEAEFGSHVNIALNKIASKFRNGF